MPAVRSMLGIGGILIILILLERGHGATLLPIFVTVETASMSPTLAPGETFVAISPQLIAEPSVGSVIVFDAASIQGGGPTVHRIVGETEAGYLTSGDANALLDQAGGEPPVEKDRLRGVALTVNGEIVTVPQWALAGSPPVERSTLRWLIAGIVLVLAVAPGAKNNKSVKRHRNRHRRRSRNWPAIAVALLVMAFLILGMGTMSAMSQTHQFEIVSGEFSAPTAGVVPAGSTEVEIHTMENPGLLPVISMLDDRGEQLSITEDSVFLPIRGAEETTLKIDVPASTGAYHYRMKEDRYIVSLPPTWIEQLHAIDSRLATVACSLSLTIPVAIGAIVFYRRYPQRERSRPGATSGR